MPSRRCARFYAIFEGQNSKEVCAHMKGEGSFPLRSIINMHSFKIVEKASSSGARLSYESELLISKDS